MNTMRQDYADDNAQKNTTPILTPAEALKLLQSAVSYCQLSGLIVRAGNAPYLCLSIDGARMDGDPPRFVLTTSSSEVITPTAEPIPSARSVRSRL